MPTALPPPCATEPAGGLPAHTAPVRCCLLTVWSTGPAGFAARALLLDGTARDFTSPFELARFFSAPLPLTMLTTPTTSTPPTPPSPGSPGLR